MGIILFLNNASLYNNNNNNNNNNVCMVMASIRDVIQINGTEEVSISDIIQISRSEGVWGT